MSDLPKVPEDFMHFMYSEVRKKMHTCKFEDKEMWFLPDSEFLKLSTSITGWLDHLCTISQCFKDLFSEHPSLRATIAKTRCKVFLIGVYSKFSLQSLAHLVSNDELNGNGPSLDNDSSAGARSRLTLDKLFSHDERARYMKLSCHFHPVKFTRGNYSREISADEVLPIKGFADENELGSGVASQVLRIQIDPDYHNFPPSQDFALKCVDQPDHGEREIAVLEKLMPDGHAPHPHIAEIYCGFKFKETHYFIAACASQNLAELIKANSAGNLDASWLRSQLHGLAAALETIHTSVPNQSICHHDLKADNILIFQHSGAPVFKITDWGCTYAQPISPRTPSPKSSSHSHLYNPPEARDGKTSRPHDVWALGCMFLELLVWQTAGWAGMKRFRDEQHEAHHWDWCVKGEKVLLPGVVEQLDVLGQGEWAGEVEVIRGMLTIDPGERVLAGDAARGLAQRAGSEGLDWWRD